MRISVRAGLVVVATGVVGVIVSPSAPAAVQTATPANFEAVAAADGVRTVMKVPGLPLSDSPADIGAPAAQARVDGLGTSIALAGAPDPGDFVLGIPPLANAAAKQGVLPDVPFVVTTNYPDRPHETRDQPGVSLEATSRASSAQATAGFAGAVTAQASAGIDENGAVMATATSQVSVLSLGVVEIHGLKSTATVRRVPGEKPEITSDIRVGSLTVAGMPVWLGPDGLQLGTGAPTGLGTNGSPAATVLEAAGLDLALLPATRSADGVVSAALQVTSRSASLEGTNVKLDGTTTITIGRALASATVVDAPASTDELAVPSVTGSSGLEVAPDDLGSGNAATLAERTQAAGPASSRLSGGAAPAASTHPRPWPLAVFYPVLVVAGLLLSTTGLFAARTGGVR